MLLFTCRFFVVVVVYLQIFRVQVRLVFVCWFVSSVAVFDHWVQQVFEHLVRLLVSSNAAHRHDERVTCRDTTWLTFCCSSCFLFFVGALFVLMASFS